MRYKVTSYLDHPHNFFICEDGNGIIHRIDLLVDKKLPGIENPEDLVGKTIETESLIAYVQIAIGVEVL